MTGVRRTDSEISLLKGNRLNILMVNGISSQQIYRSQDRDASVSEYVESGGNSHPGCTWNRHFWSNDINHYRSFFPR